MTYVVQKYFFVNYTKNKVILRDTFFFLLILSTEKSRT